MPVADAGAPDRGFGRIATWWRRSGLRTRLSPAGLRSRVQLTVRLRLALLSAGTAILAGVVVLGATYVLTASRITTALLFRNSAGPVAVAGTSATDVHASGSSVGVSAAGSGFAGGGTAIASRCLELPGTPANTPRPTAQIAEPLPAGGGGAQVDAPPASVAAILANLAQCRGRVRVMIDQATAHQHAADLNQLVVRGGLALGILALLALAVGWWVAGRILRPLQAMTLRVQRLSAQTPLGRIRLAGPPDELRSLADTFDALLGRLDAALVSDRRFVANASHELRTPLAIQETILEVALADPDADVHSLRGMGARVRQVNARSRRLIDGLMALARSQQGLARWEPVDLAVVVRDAIGASDPEAAAHAVCLQAELHPVPVRGDPVLLERLAGNLVENAVRYNRDGGWVRVRTARDGDHALLAVSNSGTAVAPGDVAGLFEPFRRGGRDRTDAHRGAGLGLSIVRAVAEAHGGSAEAQARAEGGLDVRVRLPAAPEVAQ